MNTIASRVAAWMLLACFCACTGTGRDHGRDTVEGAGERASGQGRLASVDVAGAWGLVPSRLEQQARYQSALAHDLSAHVSALARVRSASVVVNADVCSPLDPIDGRPVSRPSASVVAVLAQAGNEDTRDVRRDIARLVAAGVSGLEASQVEVAITTPDAESDGVEDPEKIPRLVSLGPFQVAQGSRASLLVLAVSLLGLIAGLATWTLVSERINRSLRRRIAQL